MISRIFVERRSDSALESTRLCADLKINLLLDGLDSVRIIHRYDVEGADEATIDAARRTIFSEPQTDEVYDELDLSGADRVFAYEYLPGQYDQRADSCEQCIAIIMGGRRPRVRTATVVALYGRITDAQFDAVKKYLINPVEAREASFEKPETLADNFTVPETVRTLDGFINCSDSELVEYINEYSLAMDADDIRFMRRYFAEVEKRDPTITELRLVDSYWSDHCRHTTFLTHIENVEIELPCAAETWADYIARRNEYYAGREKPVTLMDVATFAAKQLKKDGVLRNLDESDEINACSVKVRINVGSEEQDWLLQFKNETHNHPTEIEPFGGAATCLGGCIRDPLSGRAYVYQAMRVTGAADPRTPVADTIPGKLPQSKLTLGAAAGYSSYGNQIGLATGGVYEMYHPGYAAKRLEIGAVVGAAPAANVVREVPEPGDVVILLGGRTGRDGCGGATGSSKAHNAESLATCGAEVQKGNPPEERKIQRLFRNPDVTRMIRRCNDFGAGGVSVAVGELADGLLIDLSRVPKKYEGLDGTELAISESQERMAVVVRPENADAFIAAAAAENLEATAIATVTAEARMKMVWNGRVIVDLSREFLSSNGAPKKSDIKIESADTDDLLSGGSYGFGKGDTAEAVKALLSDLNICSQRGLAERFDSSIGASTVVMPFGGKYQLTAPQYMAAKYPVGAAGTEDASFMAYGFDPHLASRSPYHGALYAVVESVARLVAAGVDYKTAYLTLQEYFERTLGDPSRWGQPLAALLGAYKAQMELGVASIGGKDSMSGTYIGDDGRQIDVPPTLVSFAVASAKAYDAVTPEFKSAGDYIFFCEPSYRDDGTPDFASLRELFDKMHCYAKNGTATAIYAIGRGGVFEAVCKCAFGNGIGVDMTAKPSYKKYFDRLYGAFILETASPIDGELIGYTVEEKVLRVDGKVLPLDELRSVWESPLEGVFPVRVGSACEAAPKAYVNRERSTAAPAMKTAKPRVFIPVFPGTNCEYDTAAAFERAGAVTDVFVLRNYSAEALEESLVEMARRIGEAQILMLPGGFSGGDEPDGSAKFITAVLRNARVRDAVTDLLDARDGLALGICNGFQALLKSGLLPYGRIVDAMSPDDATLTFNTIGRHQSRMVRTRVASVKSPWLALTEVDDIHVIPISHGEGRLVASDEMIASLAANGQIATQYVDMAGNPSMDIEFNPNGSAAAIEGITSADGRIFGKMGHSERTGEFVAVNIPGNKNQRLFEAGVRYYAI